MLEHGFDIAELLIGFWRFLFSADFRQRKQREWRNDWGSSTGRLMVITEIVLAVGFGVGVPILAALLIVYNLPA